MSLVRKLSISLLVLALLIGTLGAAPMPAQASAQAAAACSAYHYVRWGETLYSIGLYYGVSWVTIAQLNGITRPGQIFAGQRLCVPATRYGTGGPYYPPGYYNPGYYGYYYTTISIVSVVPGTSVTVRTYGMPVGDTFDVLIGRYGTLGVGGVKVGSVKTTASSEIFTFNLPTAYADNARVAIRLQSPTSGYYAYNWFYNVSGGTGTGGSGTLPGGYYWYYPTFRIASVRSNNSVTIVTSNLPPNDKFDVYMSYIGTRGLGGYYVTSFNSGAGGTQTLTFSTPSVLYGQHQIAIRFQSPSSGYYAYNWFYNTTYP